MIKKTEASYDLDLVHKYQRGDEDAFFLLSEKYKKFARNEALKYYLKYGKSHGFIFDDIYSITFASLMDAAKSFDESKSDNFYSYWKTIADNHAINYIRNNSYEGGAKMFKGVFSLDDSAYDNGDIQYSELIGTIIDNYNHLDEENELAVYTIRELYVSFSPIEKVFLLLKMSGYTFQQISDEIGVSVKYLYSVKRKLSRKVRIKLTHR